MIVIVLIITGIIWVVFSYLSVRGIEHPDYAVLKKQGEYEIREYESYYAAEVLLKGTQKESLSRGFKILFDYISGNNMKQESIKMTAPVMQQQEEKSERIAMTAPVMQEQREESYVVSFMMPANYTLDKLPIPKDSSIKIVQRGGNKVAVLRFAGYATEERVMKKQTRLKERLKEDGYRIISSFHLALYNPPWTPPFMMRNEVMFLVQ
jgi:hypothetical protein